MSLVEVRPIEKKKWHGKGGKESFSQPITIEVLYDPNTGRYATGIPEEKAKELSSKLGLDLSDTFNPDEPHPYWSSKAARIKLPNHPIFLNTEKPTDYIKLCNLKASKFVANSMKEYEDGMYPDALFVIYNEEEQVVVEATKIQKKRDAYKLLSEMSAEDKLSIAMVLSNKNLKKQSASYIEVELEKIIDTQLDKFLIIAKSDKENLAITSMIMEAIQKGIFVKDGSSIKYMDDVIGHDMESAIDYMNDPKNQRFKLAIMAKINN